jgi:carbon storage regulator
MLVLTRKLGEEILIAGVVTVKVLEMRSGQVKLGIDAPKDIPVFRKELVDDSR